MPIGPEPLRIGVSSIVKVTYCLARVGRHPCSSAPMVLTLSNRAGPAMRTRWPFVPGPRRGRCPRHRQRFGDPRDGQMLAQSPLLRAPGQIRLRLGCRGGVLARHL